MFQRERRYRQGAGRKGLLPRLPPVDGKGQRPGQGRHGGGHRLQPSRANHRQGGGAAQAGKSLQQARQAQNMIPVVMGEQHRVQPVGADAPPAQGGLGTLAAVQQHGTPAHTDSQSRQRPFRQRLGASGAQQGDGQHGKTPLSQQYPNLQSTL